MGLAGEPADGSEFARFETDGTAIYVAREIWDAGPPGMQCIRVLLPGFGQFAFRFCAAP